MLTMDLDGLDVFQLQQKAVLETNEPVIILGKTYESFDYDRVLCDVRSLVWMTYRRGFRPIGGTGPASDQGWGCMLRCGQMMLAEALLRLHAGRDWQRRRTAGELAERRSIAAALRRVLRLFSDDKHSLYSIHQIAQMGVGEGKPVGEWFGPNTVAQVLKKLACFDDWSQLAVHVAMDNLLVLDDLTQLLATRRNITVRHTDQPDELGTLECGGAASASSQSNGPVLIVVPLRLGLTQLNQCYMKAIQAFYGLPQCVGIIGGRPNHALYFYGIVGTDKFLYLDPHTCQDSVDWSLFADADSNGEPTDDADIAESQPEDSYQCPFLLDLASSSVDPSLALCLFCADDDELTQLIHLLKTDVLPASQPPLFELMQHRPRGFPAFVPYSFDHSTTTKIKEYAVVEPRYDTDDEFEVLD